MASTSTKGLTLREKETLKECFDFFAAEDGTKGVSKEGLGKVLSRFTSDGALDLNVDLGELVENVTGNTTITFDDFEKIMENEDVKEPEEESTMECPEWYNRLKKVDKEYIENMLGEGTATTPELEQAIMDHTGRERKNAKDFLRWWFANKELLVSFRLFDRNKDGYITLEEMKKACESFNAGMTEKEITDMFQEADINNDEKIGFQEFIRMMNIEN